MRLSVNVINHMKSPAARHGYCISTTLTSMALKWREKKREIKEERKREVKTGSKRKERADEVLGEVHVTVTCGYIPGLEI